MSLPEVRLRPVVGITGLPCTGKSYIADLIVSGDVTGEVGIAIRADELGHEAMNRSGTTQLIATRFGNGVIDPDGRINRAKVAQIVFSKPEELQWLEAVLHPEINALAKEIIVDCGGKRMVALEAALLFAADMDKLCDIVLLVEASREVRLARAAKRGWNEKELSRREERLRPLFEKPRLAACPAKVIVVENNADNGGLIEKLTAALSAVPQRKG